QAPAAASVSRGEPHRRFPSRDQDLARRECERGAREALSFLEGLSRKTPPKASRRPAPARRFLRGGLLTRAVGRHDPRQIASLSVHGRTGSDTRGNISRHIRQNERDKTRPGRAAQPAALHAGKTAPEAVELDDRCSRFGEPPDGSAFLSETQTFSRF